MASEEQADYTELWKRLISVIDKQLQMNTRQKQLAQDVIDRYNRKQNIVLDKNNINEMVERFVEVEALLAEQRAIYDALFGLED
jgi:hypothetical protein